MKNPAALRPRPRFHGLPVVHGWHTSRNTRSLYGTREMQEETVDELIVRAANLIGCGAPEADVLEMLVVETRDEGLAFLLLRAGELLAKD